jgi:NAD-specific glutamate dehydrogenase
MSSAYRILKLKSGEEIITRILSQQKGKLVLERPMVFKTIVMMDGLGRQKEITVLKNWLQFTDQITTDIPKDYIATFLTPDQPSSELYDLQKEKDDTDPSENQITDATDDYNFGDVPKEFLESLGISDGESGEDWSTNPDFIIESIIRDMIESGDMDKIMKQLRGIKDDGISDIYTGDETDREDFGTRWTDWSNNPEDYLE